MSQSFGMQLENFSTNLTILDRRVDVNTFNTVVEPRNILEIDIHHTGGPDEHLLRTFNSFRVSYHFAIQSDGRVQYLVDTNNIAWHNRNRNSTTIGISFIGDFSNTKPSDRQYSSCEHLLKDIKNFYKRDFEVRGHNENSNTVCPGQVDIKRLNRVYHELLQEEQEHLFNVPSDWAKEYVELLMELGVTTGERPHDHITRQEMMTILGRLLTLGNALMGERYDYGSNT